MFSVVITTKDRLDYLKRCVDSVLSSTVKPKEIIIINDAGVHFGNELFEQSTSDVDIVIIRNEFSQGANLSRNVGVGLSKCEIVYLIDDDDAVNETSFEKRLDILSKDENVGLCFTGINIISSNDLSTYSRSVSPYMSNDYLYDLFDKGNIIGSTSRVAIRKKYFYKAGGFDEELQCFQDYDLWIRMAKVCKISNDGESNVLYTVHAGGGQISSKYKKYLEAGNYLINKYQADLVAFNLVGNFASHIHLRVAISSSSSSIIYRIKHSIISFCKRPNIKSFALIFTPYWLLRRMHMFA